VRVDDLLRTSQRSVWALGDAIGRAMFTHAGDREAVIAWHNASQRRKIRMDFDAVPHAVFVAPQIASVGLTEARARAGGAVLVGTARYADTVFGAAMDERDGFAKAVVDRQTRRILGFHVVGPHASLVIPEVANAVMRRERVEAITDCMHIFPALSDLVTETLSNLA
jgi:dihydrolipoamide dehydrogenase